MSNIKARTLRKAVHFVTYSTLRKFAPLNEGVRILGKLFTIYIYLTPRVVLRELGEKM